MKVIEAFTDLKVSLGMNSMHGGGNGRGGKIVESFETEVPQLMTYKE